MKNKDRDFYLLKDIDMEVYLDPEAEDILKKHSISYKKIIRKNFLEKSIPVLAVKSPPEYEKFIRYLEQITRYRIPLYNADIPPEQFFLLKHNLLPCSNISSDEHITLKKMEITITPETNLPSPIKEITLDKTSLKGTESSILNAFKKIFIEKNPDVLLMENAFSRLPYLNDRLFFHNLKCRFNRWHDAPIKYHGGRSYHSYGNVRYQDYPIRLKGRFLVDTSTMVGSISDIEGIIELCHLSGGRFQQVASRSFGAAFQAALVREMIKNDMIIHYKEKPLDPPMNFSQMVKSDRAGHTFDPKVGFHTDVASIDFSSMFPHIIVNKNISADTLLDEIGPFEKVHGIPVQISLRKKGLVPSALRPFLEKRMYYKKHPSAVNNKRASALKWVLVSCYGYLRFREFKLGLASSHMAICAYAREIIVQAAHLAEEKGFEIIHGVVDSLYIKKKNIKEEEVKALAREIELATGIPVSFEGIFRWIVFLPSIENKDRPVPTKHYGIYKNGDLKVRGIELRQRTPPLIVKKFQQECIERMALCTTKKEILSLLPEFGKLLRKHIRMIPLLEGAFLSCELRITKNTYKYDLPQKVILKKLEKKGLSIMPGQSIRFIYTTRGVVPVDEYTGNPNLDEYRKLLKRSLFILLQALDIEQQEIDILATGQQKLVSEIQQRLPSGLTRRTNIPLSIFQDSLNK